MLDEQAPQVIAQATERPIGNENADFPGDINVGGGFFEGHYPGNKFIAVEGLNAQHTAENVNKFYAEYPGNLVSGCWPVTPQCVFVLFSRTMSREEAEGVQKFAAGIKAKLNDELKKKMEADALVAKRQEEAAKETVRLASIGKKCEENHKKGE